MGEEEHMRKGSTYKAVTHMEEGEHMRSQHITTYGGKGDTCGKSNTYRKGNT